MAFIEQKIMDHLNDHLYDMNSVNASWDITQMGIAEFLGRTPAAVSIILSGLEKDGIVFSELRHVKGRTQRVRAYYLTDKAKKELNKMGKEKGGTIKPLISNEKPSLDLFVGREKELNVFQDWINSSTSNTLAIRGMAGVGKTIFASRALDLYCADKNIFWINLKPWVTLKSILSQIFDYLSILKGKSLSGIIARKNFSIQDITFVLEKELEDLDIIMVFDDYGQHCKKDVLELINSLIFVMDKKKDVRTIIIGREPPYSLEKDNSKLRVEWIPIECLNEKESSNLLEHENIALEFHSSMYQKTSGHPLALLLLSKFGERGKNMTGTYLEETIFSSITPEVRNILEITSFLRKPEQAEVILDISSKRGYTGIEEKGLRGMVSTSLLYTAGITYDIHDLLRSLVASKMSNREKKELHTTIAKFYQSNRETGEEILEELYHSTEAMESEHVYDLLMEHGDTLIGQGSWNEMLDSINQVLIYLPKRKQADLLLNKGYIFFMMIGDLDKSIEMYEQARDIYTQYEDTEGQIKSYYGLGMCYSIHNQYQEGIDNFDKAIMLNSKFGTEYMLSKIHIERGTAQVRIGRPNEGISELERAIEYCKITDPDDLPRAYRKLGSMYIRKGDVQKGVDILKKVVKELDNKKDSQQYLITLSLIGMGYSLLKESDESIKWFQKTLEISEEMGYIPIYRTTLSNIAEVYILSGNLDKAEEYAEKGVTVCKKSGNKVVLENALLVYGSILMDKGDLKKGKRILEEALTYDSKEPFVHGQTLEQYGRLLCKMGDIKNARKVLEQSKQIFVEIENKHFEEQVKETMRELGL